ncbi:CAP domain-containing protein [Lactobacillus psittaci]|uniref:SCP domain-containing protein n=1 Tax=Lactobacillus psittaci DSM 15354 TaxID=1122152 RepID=A0A0R1S2A5_9LACO|nr:CAP domain-containing protein [Lactobacillus psittaci]KRL63366.1 hypothetical protein FC23_GL000936 [Lactobacillus psittaci DSM 15354]
MKTETKVTMLTASALLLPFLYGTGQVRAAEFSQAEKNQVEAYQKEYKALDSQDYNTSKLYQTQPSDTNPGTLNQDYIKGSLGYVNYYRQLAGLDRETTNDQANQDAQLAAWALAKTNYPVSSDAHGILNTEKPAGMTDEQWDKAQLASFGNITFNSNDPGLSHSGIDVKRLLLDNNNIDGSPLTGHRDLILSARASKIGFGTATGKNGIRYVVQNGVFASDLVKNIWKDTQYPSKGLFPVELLNEADTPWSVYFGQLDFKENPEITITDDDTGKKVTATNVKNLGHFNYAYGYKTTIDYLPTGVDLIVGHQYTIKIGDLYTYSFKLFSEKANGIDLPSAEILNTAQHNDLALSYKHATSTNGLASFSTSTKQKLTKASNAIDQPRLPQTGNSILATLVLGLASISTGFTLLKKH